jgi:hypothetical protein
MLYEPCAVAKIDVFLDILRLPWEKIIDQLYLPIPLRLVFCGRVLSEGLNLACGNYIEGAQKLKRGV